MKNNFFERDTFSSLNSLGFITISNLMSELQRSSSASATVNVLGFPVFVTVRVSLSVIPMSASFPPYTRLFVLTSHLLLRPLRKGRGGKVFLKELKWKETILVVTILLFVFHFDVGADKLIAIWVDTSAREVPLLPQDQEERRNDNDDKPAESAEYDSYNGAWA